MTMHPSIGYTIITQEIEERARNAERRRFILDHPEQIHRRPAGWWRRMPAPHRLRTCGGTLAPGTVRDRFRPVTVRPLLGRTGVRGGWHDGSMPFTADAPSSAARMVGRDDELARLQAAFARASAGEPSAVVVAGEAGIGKSRLPARVRRIGRRAGRHRDQPMPRPGRDAGRLRRNPRTAAGLGRPARRRPRDAGGRPRPGGLQLPDARARRLPRGHAPRHQPRAACARRSSPRWNRSPTPARWS
ncbi:ATP-binding protein [Microbacterium elymi]|uniref:AAA family ATPase n=1 Tax=Microbacterium elymi TaxID=2909587 RepID=A0ABY5NHI6_9MICO|nr:AAA family ATPase [Microbacterium elymi]UUT34648.1 AAA family ATPase [Microbacterium elymi]